MLRGEILLNNRKGVLIQQGFCLNGREYGEWKFLDDQGQLSFSGFYEDDKRIGVWYGTHGKRKR